MRPTHANCGLKLRRAEEATWDQCTRNASWSYVEGKEVRGRVIGVLVVGAVAFNELVNVDAAAETKKQAPHGNTTPDHALTR